MRDFLFILLVTAVGWWLSGYDSRLTGEDYRADFARRGIRTAITCLLTMLAVLAGGLAVMFFLMIALVWAPCVSELGARIFHRMVDPDDDRKFDPKEIDRNLDVLAQLIKQGRNNEAVELCKKLQDSSEGSHLALDATLHRLYLETVESAEKSPLLANVRHLIEKGEFDQAEAQIKQMLAVHPTSGATWVLLMRLYAKNMLRPDQALAVLEPIDQPGPLHPAFTEFARKTINQWVVEGRVPTKANGEQEAALVDVETWEPEVSIDELLKSNQFATAVERLEKSINQEPRNFDLRLKLAEVYAVNCADTARASKIVQRMEIAGAFTPEQIQSAKAKLREWQKPRR